MARKPCGLLRCQSGSVGRSANRYCWIYFVQPLQNFLQFRVQQRLSDRAGDAEVFDVAEDSFELLQLRKWHELALAADLLLVLVEGTRAKEAAGVAIIRPVQINQLRIRRS